MKTLFIGAVSCAAILAATAANAQSRPVAATFMEPNHQIAEYQFTRWAEDLKAATDGRLDFEVFLAGSLAPANGMLQAVTSGLAQNGMVVSGYYPSDLPAANLIAEAGFLEPDPHVLLYAYNDYVTREAAAQEDYRRADFVHVAGLATDGYNLLCKGEVRSFADLQGKKVRTSGAGWSRAVTALGMIPVNVAWPEVYPSLERGAVDCVAADPSALNSGPAILPLVDSIMLLPLPPYFTTSAHAFNTSYWAELSPEDRKTVFAESARAMVDQLVETQRRIALALDEARAADTAVIEPDDQTLAEYQAWIDGGMGDLVGIAKNNMGIENPEAILDGFAPYVAKWKGLLDGVPRQDGAAIFAIVKENIVDQIDFSSYGLY